MKKKIFSMFLVSLVAVNLLAGCGGGNIKPGSESIVPPSAAGSPKQSEDTSQSHFPESLPAEQADGEAGSPQAIMNGFNCDDALAVAGECMTDMDYEPGMPEIPFNTEEYSAITENPFRKVSMSPLSTFSADVDTASYSNVRRMLKNGYRPQDIPSGAVRTEEMLNYFSYDYAMPEKGKPFGVTAVLGECPWNETSKLLVLGLQTEKIDFSEAPDTNLVFLIDVSGSMYSDNKLPLLKKAFGLLVDNLGEKDRVSIVTYASRDEVVIKGIPGNEKDVIMNALEGLEAGGSTNGGAGIVSAYDLAEQYFIKDGNNRVILATDGDLNVGITSESALHDLIAKERESGVFLSVLGFGMGNYSDTNMETLADYGNGNYAYIDSLSEAKKVLVEEMGATLVTVAKDVKLQIEFNPAVVSEYRLVGYENRTMAAEDFSDDTKDAGEIGAGHSVTVVYEIVPCKDSESTGSGLKYQSTSLSQQALSSDEWLTLSVRYKKPAEDSSILLEYPIGAKNYTDKPSDDFLFAAAVAEFSMVLKNSEYVGTGSYKHVLTLLDDISLNDEYKTEFYDLVDMARIQSKW